MHKNRKKHQGELKKKTDANERKTYFQKALAEIIEDELTRLNEQRARAQKSSFIYAPPEVDDNKKQEYLKNICDAFLAGEKNVYDFLSYPRDNMLIIDQNIQGVNLPHISQSIKGDCFDDLFQKEVEHLIAAYSQAAKKAHDDVPLANPVKTFSALANKAKPGVTDQSQPSVVAELNIKPDAKEATDLINQYKKQINEYKMSRVKKYSARLFHNFENGKQDKREVSKRRAIRRLEYHIENAEDLLYLNNDVSGALKELKTAAQQALEITDKGFFNPKSRLTGIAKHMLHDVNKIEQELKKKKIANKK